MTPVFVPCWTAAEGAKRAERASAEAFGRTGRVYSAPGRVNLIGEHTDYNGGLCLPFAIPHRTWAALAPRSDGAARLASAQLPDEVATVALDDIGPGMGSWAAYAAGVAWALREAGYPIGGFDAVVDSCVPFGSGLSSSAALECAIAVGLDDLHGLGLAATDAGRAVLAAACVRAENDIAGAPTGGMDQAASLRCAERSALLLDCLDGSARQVPFDPEAHGLTVLVIDTKAPHHHADGQYAARRATCEAAAARLGVGALREVVDLAGALDVLADDPVAQRRVRHIVTEIARVAETAALLDGGHLDAIGELMLASHESLRDDYEVSCPELDLAVSSAMAAGAVGARMTGGGFGGSAIALAPQDKTDEIAEEVARAYSLAGFAPPAFLLAPPSAPAG